MIGHLENPVFKQTALQRMRGGRTYGCLLFYLLFLSVVMLIAYGEFIGGSFPQATTGLAQRLFQTLIITQAVLVVLITPALTSSAITVEREQRTYDMLIMTPLSRMAIVWGKFASAMAFVVILVVCGMPLVAVLFLLGGIDISAMLQMYAATLITAAFLAAVGLAFSAICPTTMLANLLSYAVAGVAFIGIFTVGIAYLISAAYSPPGAVPFPLLMYTGVPLWMFWLAATVAFVLVIWICLRIAANYLLPDPRVGVWVIRLLLAVLYLWILAFLVYTARSGAFAGYHIHAAFVSLFLSQIAAPIVTGVPDTQQRWTHWLHPRALASGTIESALQYLLVILALGYIADLLMPRGMRVATPIWFYMAGYLWWIWSAGYLCSVLFRRRWGAFLALVAGTMILTQALNTVFVLAFGVDNIELVVHISGPMAVLYDNPSATEAWIGVYAGLGALTLLIAWLVGARRKKHEIVRKQSQDAVAGTPDNSASGIPRGSSGDM